MRFATAYGQILENPMITIYVVCHEGSYEGIGSLIRAFTNSDEAHKYRDELESERMHCGGYCVVEVTLQGLPETI